MICSENILVQLSIIIICTLCIISISFYYAIFLSTMSTTVCWRTCIKEAFVRFRPTVFIQTQILPHHFHILFPFLVLYSIVLPLIAQKTGGRNNLMSVRHIVICFFSWLLGSAEQNAKHGADDKVHIKINAMRDRMKTREKNKPEIFDTIR